MGSFSERLLVGLCHSLSAEVGEREVSTQEVSSRLLLEPDAVVVGCQWPLVGGAVTALHLLQLLDGVPHLLGSVGFHEVGSLIVVGED